MQRGFLTICVIILGMGAKLGFAQNPLPSSTKLPIVASVFNNGTLLPGGGELGVFSIPVHPGVSIGTEFRYKSHQQNEWFQTAKLAYHYHHYVQHSIQLYSELGYRRHFKNPLDVGARGGLGYLHSIPDAQVFELDSEGTYQSKNSIGRAQLMTGLSLELGYALSEEGTLPTRVFVAYQFYLQMPFVQKYVPLMPNTALHVGVSFPLWTIKTASR